MAASPAIARPICGSRRPDKAVYAYPSEFYELWSRERPELQFDPGTFGENLATEGLLDGEVSIGDRFRVGTADSS